MGFAVQQRYASEEGRGDRAEAQQGAAKKRGGGLSSQRVTQISARKLEVLSIIQHLKNEVS